MMHGKMPSRKRFEGEWRIKLKPRPHRQPEPPRLSTSQRLERDAIDFGGIRKARLVAAPFLRTKGSKKRGGIKQPELEFEDVIFNGKSNIAVGLG
jgi:hypothetical protein